MPSVRAEGTVFSLPEGRAAEEAAAPAATPFTPSSTPGTVGERFGVASSHIKLYDGATVEREFAAAEDAGAAWLRCDFAWSDLEPLPGVWNFSGADAVVERAGTHGVKLLGILGAAPPWANGGQDWRYPPTDLEAWRGYVRTVAARYRGRVAAWEVWNEENIHAFWMPEPDPEAYLELLAAASAEIRAADPSAAVVMGGVAGLGPDYLDACLSLGAAEYIDAIAYHPYAETVGEEGQPPEDTYRPKERLCRNLVAFVHWLVSLYTAKDLQVWITEVGWPTSPEAPSGVDEDTQADYLLRTLINYASTDVDRVIWFNLRDTHLNDWDRYGLLRRDFTPKASYAFYSTFTRVLGAAAGIDNATVSFSCSRPQTLEAHCFRMAGGGLALSAWKSDDAADSLSFTVNDPDYADPQRVDPLSGATSALAGTSRDAAGRITVSGLPVGKRPVIVTLERGAPEPGPEPGPQPPEGGSTFYFAEGYTGEGFQEYLCVGNVDEAEAEVEVDFLFSDGSSSVQRFRVPRGSRFTLDVNAAVGPGREVSMAVTSERRVVAERPMYFTYGKGWTGGHAVMGARGPAREWYFAEGYTGEGFDQWLCVMNPGGEAAELTFRFQTEEKGEVVVDRLGVAPRSRATFRVNELLGDGFQNSCAVQASVPVVVERPVYFDYLGTGSHHWEGGHCVMGATSTGRRFLFAEGSTREDFEEWITLQNPNPFPIEVSALYVFGPGQGEPLGRTYRVEGGRRSTIFVPAEVGQDRDVSVELTSGDGFLAERPVYFSYGGAGADGWEGGHCVIGAGVGADEWRFAEGYTGEGFHNWLCVLNPGGEEAVVEVAYLTQEEGALEPRTLNVPPRSRATLFVNQHAGAGYQLSCRLRVLAGPAVVAERPMYFSHDGRDGGHAVFPWGQPRTWDNYLNPMEPESPPAQ
ncbi:MAG: beta-galactosidase [Actinobacteria bacterium]|nr:beta-galactosidase [Actinomycetota bacterium]